MQSAKKVKILSALSMAAAAVITAKAAHAATLTLYYGQDASYANSNNNVVIGSTYTPLTGVKNAQLQRSTLGGAVVQGVSNSAATTLSLPVGSYLSLAIDALLTGNPNADAGNTAGGSEVTQPAFLGLSALAVGVSSTDATAKFLTPISTATKTLSSFGGSNTYSGTAIVGSGAKGLNGGQGSNGGTGYNVAPNWGSLHNPADVAPNEPSYDQGNGNGNYGLVGYNTGGTTNVDPTAAAGVQQLEMFATPNAGASYSDATEFVHSLIFQGLSAGTVTLQPYAVGSSSQYWINTGKGSAGTPSSYTGHTFGAGDIINTLPVLVINVIGTQPTGPSGHAILSLAATAAANSSYGSTVGALHITGSAAAGYTTAQVTGLSSSTGNVTTDAWNATTDPEIYGVDVKVNGNQATPSQLATLLAAIGGTDGAPGVTASAGVTASTADLSGGALTALDTATTTYNLFLKYAGGGPSIPLDDLGLDLSSTNDSNLVGYTFSAVSVVPEPMSLGLLALGGVGLMSRRSRRKA